MHSSFSLVLVALFVAGAAAFGIGTYSLRRMDRAAAAPQWPTLVDETLTESDVATRRELIERLSFIDSDWSRDVLRTALKQEKNGELRSAIQSALRSA